MNLDISLPLLSELEQLCRAFWKNHQNQAANHNETPVSCKQTISETRRGNLSPKLCSDEANSHTDAHGHNVRTKSQHIDQSCCDSINSDSGNSECESYEDGNIKEQAKSQHEPSLLGRTNRVRRTCRVLWERSTEDSSFL
ncbi:hypothetical protein GOODEAATRI_007809 [Goodea atripinnis]|uniref:Uncharacterized protein n=1 Tax=Goodea atripinnis TaxID=208336 RepID=A0ABV0MQ61_9TELE